MKLSWLKYNKIKDLSLAEDESSPKAPNYHQLTHYSVAPDLEEISPDFMGRGARSQELSRGPVKNKQSSFYLRGTQPEPGVASVGKYRYDVDLPKEHKLYDIYTDPEGIVSESVKAMKRVDTDDIRGAVKAAGYHGFYTSHPDYSKQGVVNLFYPTKVNKLEKAAPKLEPEQTQAEPQPKGPKPNLTVAGKEIKPNESIKANTKSQFDEQNGILHTPRGSFKVFIPNLKDQDYQKILNSSDIQDFHENAMSNWMNFNKLIRSGHKMPDEVIAHSNLFSILSANNPVPSQELAYSRLVDVMNQKGLDPRTKDFADSFSAGGAGRQAWKESDSPTEFPQHSNSYWTGKAKPAIIQTMDSKETGRKAGEISPVGFLDSFSDRISKYPQAHQYITDLHNRFGGDPQKIVGQMMADKKNVKLPKDHPSKAGMGLGSKTSRFSMSMLGGGTTVVPDTHFIRHTFGIDSNRDEGTSDYLKQVLWDPKNHDLLNKLDSFYKKRHPAVKYVENKYFGGKEDPHSTFPGFWLHWLTISPHEKAMGIGKPYAANNITDHTPFFDKANEILERHGLNTVKKSDNEDSGDDFIMRSAQALKEINDSIGPEMASMLYYDQVLPALLRIHEKRQHAGEREDLQPEERTSDMEKANFLSRVALAGVAAAGISSSIPKTKTHTIQPVRPHVEQTQTVNTPSFSDIKKDKLNDFEKKFRRAVSATESSYGLNTDHEMINTGMHKGTSAIGKYGLTPILIKETVLKHPKSLKNLQYLTKLDYPNLKSEMKKNPDIEKAIANAHIRRLVKNFGQDPEVMAYAWLNGITGTHKALKERKDIKNHWHVKKLMNTFDRESLDDISVGSR